MFSLFSRKKRPHRSSARRTAAPPQLEWLEDRLVMSVAAEEQLLVYLLNRARNDPFLYAQTELQGVIDPKTGKLMSEELNSTDFPRRGPLAVNDMLLDSSEQKANALPNSPWGQGQPNPPNPHLGYEALIQSKGYLGDVGESLSAGISGPASTLQQLIVDASSTMNGHRKHLLGAGYWVSQREVGVGHCSDSSSYFGDYWAIHTGVRDPAHRFITGVVFNDVNGNKVYDLNEGLAGVTVSAGGSSVVTNAAGGYSILVKEGTHAVLAQGAGFKGTAGCSAVQVGFDNVEVDFLSGTPEGIVNFNFDQKVPVTVTVTKFVQIDNPDDGRLGGQQGDFYARLWINGKVKETEAINGNIALLSDPYTITPNWTFTEHVDYKLKTVQVGIEIFDEDPVDADDPMDVNPTAGKLALNLTYNLWTNTWTADVPQGTPDNQNEYQGNGDDNRGRITFDISQKESIGQRQQGLHLPGGAIEVHAWNDLNLNGVHERTVEPYQEGWTIYLDENENGVLDPGERWLSTKDQLQGGVFGDLVPGKTCTVAEVIKPGWRQTFPGGPGTHRVTVEPGGTSHVGFGNAQVGRIHGRVWNDSNGNSLPDEGLKAGMPGWEVYLDLDRNGRWEASEARAITSDDGSYTFEVLRGSYTVAEVLQAGWQRTSPVIRDGTHQVNVEPNQDVFGVDFGNQAIPLTLAGQTVISLKDVQRLEVRPLLDVTSLPSLSGLDRMTLVQPQQYRLSSELAPLPTDTLVGWMPIRSPGPEMTSIQACDVVFSAQGAERLFDPFLPVVDPMLLSLFGDSNR